MSEKNTKCFLNCSFLKVMAVFSMIIALVLSSFLLWCDPEELNNIFLMIIALAFLFLTFYTVYLYYKSEKNSNDFHNETERKLHLKREEETFAKENKKYRIKLLEWEKTYQIITALAQKTETKNAEGDKITTHKINIELIHDLEEVRKKLSEIFAKKNDA